MKNKIIKILLEHISIERLLNSQEDNFNDIPMIDWDTPNFLLEKELSKILVKRNDFVSVVNSRNLLKEIARGVVNEATRV